jgi:hypothetical protein
MGRTLDQNPYLQIDGARFETKQSRVFHMAPCMCRERHEFKQHFLLPNHVGSPLPTKPLTPQVRLADRVIQSNVRTYQ